MNMELNTQVGALFKLVAHKGDGIPTRETEWFHNIVLDTGLVRMGVGTWIDRCCVGTGNSTPAVTQTALDTFKASTTTKNTSSTAFQTTTSPYYVSATVRWRFGEGVAAGNISEVGLGWGNSNLWNRALIKDSSGNPTTITVLSDEYLDVISEIRIYPTSSYSGAFNLLDKTGAVVSNHTVTGYPLFGNVANTSALFEKFTFSGSYPALFYTGTISSSPTTGGSGTETSSGFTYVDSNPTTTSVQRVVTVPLGIANLVHQSFICIPTGAFSSGSYGWGYKFQISPTITKTNSQVMTYTFTMSWGRYTP